VGDQVWFLIVNPYSGFAIWLDRSAGMHFNHQHAWVLSSSTSLRAVLIVYSQCYCCACPCSFCAGSL